MTLIPTSPMPDARPRVSNAATAAYVLALVSGIGTAAALYLAVSGSAVGEVVGIAWATSGVVTTVVLWVLGRVAEDVHIIRQTLNR